MKEIFSKIGKSEIRNLLAVMATVGAYTMLHFMLVKPIPIENKDTVNLALGLIIGATLGPAYSFFFGSSKNESDNNKKATDEKH